MDLYNIVALLGSGNYGDVYLIEHFKNKKKYAMKLLEKEKLISKIKLIKKSLWNFLINYKAKNMMRYAITERNIM